MKATAVLTTQGARLLRLEQLLRSPRLATMRVMRDTLKASPATIKRDLMAMREELGADLRYDRLKRAYVLSPQWPGILALLMDGGKP